MFKSIILQLTPKFVRRRPLLVPPKPLITICNFQSNYRNKNVEEWLESLAEDQQKRVRLIQNEIALKLAEMKKMPQLDQLHVADYMEMLEMSNARRQRFYDYLHASRTADTNSQIKKAIRERVKQAKIEMDAIKNPPTNHIDYGLGKNTLILKLQRNTITSWRNQKLLRSILLNETPLIFDCGFCDKMTKYEISDTARQLKHSFSENRYAQRPFVMHFCNMDINSELWKALRSQIPNINNVPIRLHSGDIMDVFPPEKLVYLSPDADQFMTEFNPDDFYVVGSIVDKGSQMPLTLAKAKRLNIRCARLPLDRYIKFHSHKTLTLDQMTRILLELKKSQDWKKAFKHVPRRKVIG